MEIVSERDWVAARIAAAKAGGAPVAEAAIERIEGLLRKEFAETAVSKADLSVLAKELLAKIIATTPARGGDR